MSNKNGNNSGMIRKDKKDSGGKQNYRRYKGGNKGGKRDGGSNESGSDFGSVRYEGTLSRCGKSNDPSWYNKNNALLYDTANIFFSRALGPAFPAAQGTPTWTDAATIPGVMTINYSPAFGITSTPADPLNVAAFNLYSATRKANSGSRNYDAPDLMLYVLALDQVNMVIEELRRVYKTSRTYAMTNSYWPMVVVQALGYDLDAINSDPAQCRALINTLVAKIARFNVPDTLPLFNRHSWMNSNIYSDSSTDKAQLYAYVQDGFFMYSEVGSATGGSLRYFDRVTAENDGYNWLKSNYPGMPVNSFTKMFAFCDKMISAIAGSQDFYIMSGDIDKAFPSLIKYVEIGESEFIAPVYDEEVLQQIHNTVTIGRPTIPNLVQNLNDVSNGPYLTWEIINTASTPTTIVNLVGSGQPKHGTVTQTPYISSVLSRLLNVRQQNPSPDVVMVSTRNMSTWVPGSNPNTTFVTCGSEIFFDFTTYRYSPTDGSVYSAVIGSDSIFPVVSRGVNVGTKSGTTQTINSILPIIMQEQSTLGTVIALSQFDWHPILYLGYLTVPFSSGMEEMTTSGAGVFVDATVMDSATSKLDVDYLGDLNNFTIMDRQTLLALHRTALLSELDVQSHT